MSSDTQQLNDLAELYRSYSEEELKELAHASGDLTDVAQQALESEFTRRGLHLPARTIDSASLQDNSTESSLHAFAADATEECTFEFAQLEDAYVAQSVLQSAGIESVVPTSQIMAIDTHRLIVSPNDAKAAELLLSRPDPSLTAQDAVFAAESCPQCGASDPVLQAVEPTNEWHCEACNHTWQDTELA